MSGTRIGGKKAAETNKKRHGKTFYADIGRKGGKNGHTGGFAASPERARIAGRKGGLISSKNTILTLEERRNEVEEMLRQEKEMEAYEAS